MVATEDVRCSKPFDTAYLTFRCKRLAASKDQIEIEVKVGLMV